MKSDFFNTIWGKADISSFKKQETYLVCNMREGNMRGGLPGRLFKMISSHSFKSQMMAMQYWGAQHVKQVVLHQGQVELSSQFHRMWPPHFAQSLFPWSTGTAEAPPGARTIEASIIANISNLVIEAPLSVGGITHRRNKNIANGSRVRSNSIPLR